MKKFMKIFLLVVGVLGVLVIGASLLMKPSFEKHQQKSEEILVKMTLNSVYISAQVAYAEDGIFPVTIDKLEIADESLITKFNVNYKGSSAGFTATAEHKGNTYTIDQDKKLTRNPPFEE